MYELLSVAFFVILFSMPTGVGTVLILLETIFIHLNKMGACVSMYHYQKLCPERLPSVKDLEAKVSTPSLLHPDFPSQLFRLYLRFHPSLLFSNHK